MVVVILVLLVAGECLVAFGGLWLALELGREVHWLAGTIILLGIIPAGWWLGERTLRVFDR